MAKTGPWNVWESSAEWRGGIPTPKPIPDALGALQWASSEELEQIYETSQDALSRLAEHEHLLRSLAVAAQLERIRRENLGDPTASS